MLHYFQNGESGTGGGKVKLFEGESELMTEPNVILCHGDAKVQVGGSAILTSHRVIYYRASTPPLITFLPLSLVIKSEGKTAFMSSSKILLHLHPLQQQAPPPPGYVSLVFNDKGYSSFLLKLNQVLQAGLYRQPAVISPPKGEFTKSAGIGGIMKRVEVEQSLAGATMEVAFKDLDGLMTHARDLVDLLQKYTARSGSEGDGDDSEDRAEYEALLKGMGIAQPVTRESAGSAYDQQLAREVAAIISPKLERVGGMMTLTDVYCVVNRARGTLLVSPEDLMRACGVLSKLEVGVKMHTFPSGVIVLQSVKVNAKDYNDQIDRAFSQPTHAQNGLSILEAAALLKCSVVLAKEHLLEAERNERICRDDPRSLAGGGIRFYPNLFAKA